MLVPVSMQMLESLVSEMQFVVVLLVVGTCVAPDGCDVGTCFIPACVSVPVLQQMVVMLVPVSMQMLELLVSVLQFVVVMLVPVSFLKLCCWNMCCTRWL